MDIITNKLQVVVTKNNINQRNKLEKWLILNTTKGIDVGKAN